MRCVSLNLDLADIEALRQAIVAYLSDETRTDTTAETLRLRLRTTLSELDAVLNRPAPRRLVPSEDHRERPAAPQPHLRLVQSVNDTAGIPGSQG